MTQFTYLRIKNDPEVYSAVLGPFPNGLYGVYIGAYDETPSGSVRPRTLLSSDGVFKTSEEAKTYGESVIQKVREGKHEEIPVVPC